MDCSVRYTAPGAEAVRETALAVLLPFGEATHWIPKSLLQGDYRVEIDIPMWLALKLGLEE